MFTNTSIVVILKVEQRFLLAESSLGQLLKDNWRIWIVRVFRWFCMRNSQLPITIIIHTLIDMNPGIRNSSGQSRNKVLPERFRKRNHAANKYIARQNND